MGLFGSICTFFKSAGNSIYKSVLQPIGNGISKGATTIYNSALKPAYENIIKPLGNMGMSLVKTAVTSEQRFIEGSTDMALNLEKAGSSAIGGLGGFLSNPLSYVAIGIGAIIILPKVLNKM